MYLFSAVPYSLWDLILPLSEVFNSVKGSLYLYLDIQSIYLVALADTF